MVGERFLSELHRNGALDHHRVVVIGEEPRPAYDRVHLSSYVTGAGAEELTVADPAVHRHPNCAVMLGQRVTRIDREAQVVHTDGAGDVAYDTVILATGSAPFVPPIPGRDADGCHVYRTLADLDGITADAATARRGVVIGGGLLGLEAANALRLLGLSVTVVEFAPRLMPRQLDDMASAALRGRIEELGIAVRLATSTETILSDESGRVNAVAFADGQRQAAEMVVFSAGIRPRDRLAREAGLPLGERGGVAVDHTLATADPRIFALGECADVAGTVYGLVGPGYAMAKVLAARLVGQQATFDGADTSTRLKLLGVEVASLGDALGATPECRSVVFNDPVGAVYRKVVTSADGDTVLGAVMVGDTSRYADLQRLVVSGRPAGTTTAGLAAPATEATEPGPGQLADDDLVCTCNSVTKAEVCTAVRDHGANSVADVKRHTDAGTGCGSCTVLCQKLVDAELQAQGIAVDTSLCAHFAYTRQELFDIVRVRGHRTFTALLTDVGTGSGCEICKPTVASILATQHNDYILAPDHAPLQDTNDRFLANIQKNGTYSVVPRVPGGEITPDKLIVLGQVAAEFDLYTKITGGQRIDLFGARLDQLPAIWQRLIEAGFESGHAYGKALRTVKSCVGRSWCRYGVQDSTTLAVDLEQRYRGLRAPHKIKMAVSGCSRECAEAQAKDVGVIATEKGWNLYVCGNGGMKPQHAVLFATDMATDDLIRTIDRFLAYYVRTADKLERTATWLNRLDGGIEHIRAVVLDDSLGLAAELESAMAHHVATYACEWKATLEDPARLDQFASYVDDNQPDADLAWVRERGQRRPATPEERRLLPVLSTGPTPPAPVTAAGAGRLR